MKNDGANMSTKNEQQQSNSVCTLQIYLKRNTTWKKTDKKQTRKHMLNNYVNLLMIFNILVNRMSWTVQI